MLLLLSLSLSAREMLYIAFVFLSLSQSEGKAAPVLRCSSCLVGWLVEPGEQRRDRRSEGGRAKTSSSFRVCFWWLLLLLLFACVVPPSSRSRATINASRVRFDRLEYVRARTPYHGQAATDKIDRLQRSATDRRPEKREDAARAQEQPTARQAAKIHCTVSQHSSIQFESFLLLLLL